MKRSMMISLFDSWKASGMNQADFERTHQVNLSKFWYRITRLRKGTGGGPAFIYLKGCSHQDPSIRYPSGVELVLSAHAPIDVLRSLINL